MRRAALAKRLIGAANDAGRRRLLTENLRLADARLAAEIRKACIAAWAVEPAETGRSVMALRCLLKINDIDEIRANCFWASGISDITRAKFETAITDLDNSAEIFTRLDRVPEAAQTRVAKLVALAMLSRYDEAICTGHEALKIFVRAGDQLAAGKIEMNLSNIVSRRALHHEAEKYCRSARRRFIKAGARKWRTMAENGLANTYAELNEFEKADRYYHIALESARGEKMHVTEAEIEASIGNLALLRGRYGEALNFLELSRQKYDKLGMPHQSAIADLEIADIYSELNLGSEATAIYERVTGSFRHLKLIAEEARARLNYGRTAASFGNNAVAERELKKALKLFENEQNRSGQTSVLLSLAKLAIGKQDHEAARGLLAKAAAAMNKHENPRHPIQLDLLEGELLRETGHYAKAETKLSGALILAKKHRQMNAMQGALNALGKIAVERGETKQARSLFSAAIKIIERLRSPLAAEEFSMAFFASKLEPFENLAQVLLSDNRVKDAFRVTESGRARSLLDAMPGSSDRSSPVSAKLREHLGELRAELNFVYKRFDSSAGADALPLRADIDRVETKLADTIRQINSIGVAKAGRLAQQTGAVDLSRLQEQLGAAAAAMIEFVEFDGRISAFVLNRSGVRFVRDLTTTAELGRSLEDLHFQFGALRYGGVQIKRFLHQMTERTDGCLKRLYDQLLRPIEALISGDRIVIVPTGMLNYVPFHALHDGCGYVVERFETSSAPSAAVWSALRSRKQKKIRNALLMAYADEQIPLVENEVREVESILPHPKTLIGDQATFAEFTRNAPQYDLIHLACHGQFRPENPMFSSLHLADGWITVRDVCSHKLRARLVTLSACETGVSHVFAGEEILGLSRGFLTAGADTLIVSLWAVNDDATGRLMRSVYHFLQRGESIAASLRRAQLDFVGRGEHPFYWSPFVVIGK